jgi:transcriptional regulator with XRE-family HTH domain
MADVVLHEALGALGARVRRCRELRGWTQVELAERSGLHQTTISTIECGKRGWETSVETLWRLAWALGTSLDMLVGLPVLRGEG